MTYYHDYIIDLVTQGYVGHDDNRELVPIGSKGWPGALGCPEFYELLKYEYNFDLACAGIQGTHN